MTILPPVAAAAVQRFRIGFDPRDRDRVLDAWGQILSGQQWVEGPFTERFEEKWSAWNGLPAEIGRAHV